jgi:hypothetical protein
VCKSHSATAKPSSRRYGGIHPLSFFADCERPLDTEEKNENAEKRNLRSQIQQWARDWMLGAASGIALAASSQRPHLTKCRVKQAANLCGWHLLHKGDERSGWHIRSIDVCLGDQAFIRESEGRMRVSCSHKNMLEMKHNLRLMRCWNEKHCNAAGTRTKHTGQCLL